MARKWKQIKFAVPYGDIELNIANRYIEVDGVENGQLVIHPTICDDCGDEPRPMAFFYTIAHRVTGKAIARNLTMGKAYRIAKAISHINFDEIAKQEPGSSQRQEAFEFIEDVILARG